MPTQPSVGSAQSLRSVHGRRGTRYVNRPTIGQCFDVEASRDVNGWVIRIPEIDGVTRASRRATVELAARTWIASQTGIPIGYVAVLVRD